MGKVLDFFKKNEEVIILASSALAITGIVVSATLYSAKKDRETKIELADKALNMPDSYWDSQARMAEAKANKSVEIAKVEADTKLQLARENHQALQNMPAGYFEMETAKINREANVKAAEITAQAQTAAVRETTDAFNNTIKTLADTVAKNEKNNK